MQEDNLVGRVRLLIQRKCSALHFVNFLGIQSEYHSFTDMPQKPSAVRSSLQSLLLQTKPRALTEALQRAPSLFQLVDQLLPTVLQ